MRPGGLGHRVGRDAEMLVEIAGRRRRAEGRHAHEPARRADESFPALAHAGFDGDACGRVPQDRVFNQLPDKYLVKTGDGERVVNVFRNVQETTQYQYFTNGQSAEVEPDGAYLTNEMGWPCGTLSASELEDLIARR